MDIESVLEQELMAQASKFVDATVPPGGAPTFDTTGLAGLLGRMDLTRHGSDAFGDIAREDLMASGSAAFGSFLQREDLVATGSAAFGSISRGDLVYQGSAAFDGLDGFGSWIRKIRSNIGGIFRKKKRNAKVALNRVAKAQKESVAKAEDSFKKSQRASNVYQRERLLKQADELMKRAEELRKRAQELAEATVNPKITRAEVKAAVEPVVKEVARDAAQAQKKIIREAAALKKRDPVAAARLAQNPERIEEAVKQEVVQKISWKERWGQRRPAPVLETKPYRPGPGKDISRRRRPGESLKAYLQRIAGQTSYAVPAGGATPPPIMQMPGMPGYGTWRGPLKMGSRRRVRDRSALPEAPRGLKWQAVPGSTSAVGRSMPQTTYVLVKRTGPEQRAGYQAKIKSADLMFGLETVTQPAEYGDIVDTWQSDEVYGDSQGLF